MKSRDKWRKASERRKLPRRILSHFRGDDPQAKIYLLCPRLTESSISPHPYQRSGAKPWRVEEAAEFYSLWLIHFDGRRLRYVDDDTVTKPSRRARKPKPGDNSVSFSQIGISDVIILPSGHRVASPSFDYLFSFARLSFCNSYFKSLPAFEYISFPKLSSYFSFESVRVSQ